MKQKRELVRLLDYKPSAFLAESVHLTFQLAPKCTIVHAKIRLLRKKPNVALVLNGKDLELVNAKINGKNLNQKLLKITPNELKVPGKLIPSDEVVWEATTKINPEDNTSLEGLYLSDGTYCTQCEAEGFRKITYFLDRPDVMSIYSVRIEGDEPILLSNGNLVSSGPGFVEWHDPWPKPSYLFALVAGDLAFLRDTYVTKSGRNVNLRIYAKENQIDQCSYAMHALKRAMKWDEDEYNREYDLDLFMIVAIDHFNMGAMENKGLNIFNSKYILADSKTATDRDYDFIERIVAHEYFHNWTGNRITCRDWFQLCLKEGLTVFRDQQFSADMRYEPVKRIEDVINLKTRQFREDDGPLAHPVRPNEYLEINNFYTATVYEKGAEIVRMLQLIAGSNRYKMCIQEFFDQHDGRACAVEDWLDVFAKGLKMDLEQFSLWYSVKGRPTVNIQDSYINGEYTLKFSQNINVESGLENSPAMLIPITLGLLDKKGNELRKSHTILFSKKVEIFKYGNFKEKPIPSLLRGFSAPVSLNDNLSIEDRLLLATHDTDLFNRWNAIKDLSLDSLEKLIYDGTPINEKIINCIVKQISDEELEPAFRALVVTPPSQTTIFNHLALTRSDVEPVSIYNASQSFKTKLANASASILLDTINKLSSFKNYEPNSYQSGARALKLSVLDLLCYLNLGEEIAKTLFKNATNMTEKLGSLNILIKHDQVTNELDSFYETWNENNNVIDKWFSAQAVFTPPIKSLSVLSSLTKHPAFSITSPNRFRSLIGSFASGNMCGFHERSGKGYNIVTEWLMKLDSINPQTAALICTVFDNWRVLDADRQEKIKDCLERLLNMNNVSKNMFEIASKVLRE